MRVSKRVLGLGTALAVAAGLGVAGLPTPDSEARETASDQAPTRGSEPASSETSTVTLITGDTVTVRRGGPGDRRGVMVQPGPGRDDVRFLRKSDGERLYVIPSDANELVAAGTLDRRLFDVTGLIEQGYGDDGEDLPLIVSYGDDSDRAATRNALADASIRTTTTLSSVDGAAVTVDGSALDDGWATLRSAVRDEEVERVWLDGRREALLDESVPQIGAPRAWDAGYTGKGQQVAVLDTGIDPEHPDLADAVAAAKDFSDSSSGTKDKDGHGTHVASTIVGSGKASGGKYVGVAPDAKLVVGKVLDDDGYGTDSGIIEGMEWATETKKAGVVSMSLGGWDEPGRDPLERAVDNLTEQTGALFVVAAGNDGPGPESISTPASAPSSLAVGAVTKKDRIADFSSRGPTIGKGLLKPDVTAPGVNIVAAKAKGTNPSQPVGEHYMSASGTSMATPHVAGAAALLAQQHQDWTAPELKAALMTSAKPNPKLGPYDQGTGRIDLTSAIEQTVLGEPASIQFGVQRWPHDDDKPVEKKLTYRNHGDQPVDLDLEAELTDPNGEPAPDKAVRLSTDTLTVPAGKTASVTVTSDTRHNGPDGHYTGQVIATAGEQTVHTPIATEREVESYDVTVKAIGPNGNAANGEVQLLMVKGDHYAEESLYVEDGEAKFRLPKGDYVFDALLEKGEKFFFLNQPTVHVEEDTTVTADAREAKPLSTTLKREDALPVNTEIGYVRERPALGMDFSMSLMADTFEGLYSAQIGPDEPTEGMTGYVTSQWTRKGKVRNIPYVYTLFDTEENRFPTGYERDVTNGELAKLKSTYHAQPDHAAALGIYAGPEWLGWYSSMLFEYDLPTKVTHYVDGGDVGVFQDMEMYTAGGDVFEDSLGMLSSPWQIYPIGKATKQRWNAAVFAPWPKGHSSIEANRVGDELTVSLPLYSDADGNAGGWFVDRARTTLTRNGEQIASSKEPGFIETEVPSGEAEYQLATTANRSSTSTFSTRTKASWTFHSDTAGEDGTVLPIWGARFAPKVDQHNIQHDKDGTSKLPIEFVAPEGYENAKITDAELEVSTDNGKNWNSVELEPNGRNSYVAQVRTPKDAEHVSLRTTTTDANGNESSLEVLRAYGVSR